MKLVNIGYGNLLLANRIVAIVSPDSAPVKRIIGESKEGQRNIDATYGRRTKSVIITDSNHVVQSAISAEEIARRIQKEDGGLSQKEEADQ